MLYVFLPPMHIIAVALLGGDKTVSTADATIHCVSSSFQSTIREILHCTSNTLVQWCSWRGYNALCFAGSTTAACKWSLKPFQRGRKMEVNAQEKGTNCTLRSGSLQKSVFSPPLAMPLHR